MTLRKGLNLNLESLDTFFMLLHGDLNTFKTHLCGSMLRWVLQKEGSVVYLNLAGEDGMRTLANFPEIKPSEHLWEADDYHSIEQAQEDLEAKPVEGLVIDGGKAFAEKVALKITKGVNRPLMVSNEKGVSNTDWPDMHFYLPQMIQRLRRCGKWVIMTCTSDVAASPLDTEGRWFEKKSRKIRPDFPGKSSGFSGHWFDFMGYCEMEASLGKITRQLHFQYDDRFATRARVVTPFKKAIKVPEGPDCWEVIYKELEKHCVRGHLEETATVQTKGKLTL